MEPACPVHPADVKVLCEERRDDHAHVLLHPPCLPQLPHACTHNLLLVIHVECRHGCRGARTCVGLSRSVLLGVQNWTGCDKPSSAMPSSSSSQLQVKRLRQEAHLHLRVETQSGPAAKPSACLRLRSIAVHCSEHEWERLGVKASGAAASMPGLARQGGARTFSTPVATAPSMLDELFNAITGGAVLNQATMRPRL